MRLRLNRFGSTGRCPRRAKNYVKEGARIGSHRMQSAAPMEFLGGVVGGERSTAIVWRIFWSVNALLCSRSLRQKTRLQRLRAEVVPLLLWVCAALRLKDALRMAEAVVALVLVTF